MIKRAIEAYKLTRAAHLARLGRTSESLVLLKSMHEPRSNRAVIEALKSYLFIVEGAIDEARSALETSRRSLKPDTENGAFIARYCKYLDAILEGRTQDFNRLADELGNAPETVTAKSFLVIDKPIPELR